MRIDRSKRLWLFGVTAGAFFGMLMACSNNDDGSPTDGDLSSPITIEDIIASPKAAGPGDTLRLSAIVVSSTPNEHDIPTMQWKANGGAFLEDNQSTVRWVAPAGGGIYQVVARATNTVSSASDTADIFVGSNQTVVANEAGAVRLQPNQTDLYYSRTGTVITGVEIYSVVGGVVDDAVQTPASLDQPNNRQIVYARDLSFEVHAADSIIHGEERSPVRVILGDFASKTYQRLSVDTQEGTRHALYHSPDIAPDNRSIAFTGVLPPADPAGADSFDIFVYDRAAATRRKVTATHAQHRYGFATWSTDQSWLTFISDRVSRFRWELYGMPVTGGVVDTVDADVVKLSDTGGTLASGSNINVKPLMAWNPVVPTLVVRATDNVLYLIATNPTGATQIEIDDFAGTPPTQLVWSPDGSLLALTTDRSIYTVTLGGAVTPRLQRGSDTFADLAWSPDGRWLVYRATRAPSAWFEVLDLNAPSSPPLTVTAAEPTGVGTSNLAQYRGFMSMSPAWSTANIIYYPSFATGKTTPGIVSVDITGLLQ